jgi:endo-1,3-1,4-beta-glycanase ExoK
MQKRARPLAAAYAARARTAARAAAAKARRAALTAIAHGAAAARAASAHPLAVGALRSLRAVADLARRSFVAGFVRLRGAARRVGAASAPHVARLLARVRAVWAAVERGLAWLRRALGPAALALALMVAGAAVLAPAALMAAAGVAILGAVAPKKSLADVVEALADANVNFIDRFTRLNTARWSVSHGWSNGAWTENDWRREQVRVTPEGLAITLAPNPPGEDKPYASGEIATHETYLYGYFEARLRIPRGQGLVVGFFTFTRPEGRGSWNEIDMEFIGRDSRWLEVAHHVEGRASREIVVLPFDAAEEFHTYAFEWRPDAVRWYVDNVLVHEARGPRVERMTRPQRFYVNLWNSRQLYRWVGHIDPNGAPWTLTVACVARAPEYRGVSLCAP